LGDLEPRRPVRKRSYRTGL